MDWIFAHYQDIAFGLLVADKIASLTPPSLVICKIPIGRWDNQIVDGLKNVFKAVLSGKKSAIEEKQTKGS